MSNSTVANALLKGLLRHILVTSAVFAFSTIVIVSVQNEVTVADLSNALKLVSLFILILINGEIAHGIDREQVDIKRMNQTILGFTIIVTAILISKMIGLRLDGETTSAGFQRIFSAFQDYILWLTIAPIVLYAMLDFYIAFVRNSNKREKVVAKSYILFVDAPIVFPLIFVIIIAIGHIAMVGDTSSIDIFVSGAVSLVIVASSIAAKVVDDIDDSFLDQVLADEEHHG